MGAALKAAFPLLAGPGSRASLAEIRATAAALIHLNGLRIFRDAEENYPDWEAAIQGGRKTIHIEGPMIIQGDEPGIPRLSSKVPSINGGSTKYGGQSNRFSLPFLLPDPSNLLL